MIREIVVEDISMDQGEDEIKRVIGPDSQGKILKVFVRFSDEEGFNANLKIITKEGEEIINVEKKNGNRALYYPRSSIESGIYREDSFVKGLKDYFYFLNGLLIYIKIDNPDFKGKVIEKIRIIYEDLNAS